MVPLYGTCQLTASGTFIYVANAEIPEILGNFNLRFPSANAGTDRHLVQNSYILVLYTTLWLIGVRFMSHWLS